MSEMGIIDRAVLALKQFVDDLAHGEANVPLRLFPAYRDLAALQGKTEGSEKDLFFPESTGVAPAHPAQKELPKGELGPYLLAQRARFQRGLLAWIRNQPAGLEEMRQAVDALYQIAAQLPEPRVLWWAGVGLIEAFQQAPEAEWVALAKPLCNKI